MQLQQIVEVQLLNFRRFESPASLRTLRYGGGDDVGMRKIGAVFE
jgi:hypothetical protein